MNFKIHELKCACCNESIGASFTSLPDDLPKLYCRQCTRFITLFPTKYGVSRYDTTKINFAFGGDRPGTMTYYTYTKFLESDYYEENKGHPILKQELDTPINKP